MLWIAASHAALKRRQTRCRLPQRERLIALLRGRHPTYNEAQFFERVAKTFSDALAEDVLRAVGFSVPTSLDK